MKLLLHSDGTPLGTTVYAVGDDGSQHALEGISGVMWEISANGNASMTLGVECVEAYIQGDMEDYDDGDPTSQEELTRSAASPVVHGGEDVNHNSLTISV